MHPTVPVWGANAFVSEPLSLAPVVFVNLTVLTIGNYWLPIFRGLSALLPNEVTYDKRVDVDVLHLLTPTQGPS